MRLVVTALLLIACASPVAAGDGFGLELDEEWFRIEIEEGDYVPPPTADRIALELDDASREALVYSSAITARSEREFRLALWNSPMGRLMYNRTVGDAMLGREGLVGGGRMMGIGIAPTTALGDGASSPLRQLMNPASWSELSFGETLQSGLQIAVFAALLHYMAENAD
jgi:hypothetical protein